MGGGWGCDTLSHGLPGVTKEVMTWTYEDPHTNQHAVRLILECLREVAATCLPLQVRRWLYFAWLRG